MQTGLTAAITIFENMHKRLSSGIHREKYLGFCEYSDINEMIKGAMYAKKPLNTREFVRSIDGFEFSYERPGYAEFAIEIMYKKLLECSEYSFEELDAILAKKPNIMSKLHKLEKLGQEFILSNFHANYFKR